jgi:threonine/homoserine/homoserine lactone efflux protein
VISMGALVGIAAVSVVMVLTPGPNMIYLVSRSITQGRRAGLTSLMGIAVGFLIYLVAAIAGIATLFALVPTVYVVIKLAGAAYLLWLAWQTVRPGGQSVFKPKDLPVDLPHKLFTMGLITSLLNPKIAIMYISLLPQFVDPNHGSVAAQSLALGLIQISISLTIDAIYVLAAGSMAAFFGGRPRWLNAQRYVMGTLLAGFAISIGLA